LGGGLIVSKLWHLLQDGALWSVPYIGPSWSMWTPLVEACSALKPWSSLCKHGIVAKCYYCLTGDAHHVGFSFAMLTFRLLMCPLGTVASTWEPCRWFHLGLWIWQHWKLSPYSVCTMSQHWRWAS
jgi:hypothetical protein